MSQFLMSQSVPSISPFCLQKGSWASKYISKANGRGANKFPFQKHCEYWPQLILFFKGSESHFRKCLWICISWLVHLPSQLWPNAFWVEPSANTKPFSHFQAPSAGGALLLVDWQHRHVPGLTSGSICCWTVPCLSARWKEPFQAGASSLLFGARASASGVLLWSRPPHRNAHYA